MRTRRGRVSNKRGQSIVEYLVVAAAIILAILTLTPNIRGRMQDLGNQSASNMGNATTQLGGIVAARH